MCQEVVGGEGAESLDCQDEEFGTSSVLTDVLINGLFHLPLCIY